MIMSYVMDFISFLFEKEELKKEIRNIILFGSVASGKYDDKSDVDIFVDVYNTKNVKAVEKKVKEQLKLFEEKATRIWYPRGVKNNISLIVGDIRAPRWENLKYDIISNGIQLYGKFIMKPKEAGQNVIITFSLNNLKQAKKMKLIRTLYGYRLKKYGKIYEQQGLLEKYGGTKLSSNSIMVPTEKIKEFRRLFSEFRISPQIMEIWTR